jgi:tripartite-type tricarboxylate transporter receptor subunit TctC
MKLPRRKFLHLAAGAARAADGVTDCFGANLSGAASAHGRRLSGRGRERHHRSLKGQRLSERLGQPFVVENRPGAATNIATEAVVRAPADGYTLLLFGSSSAINATFYDNLPFNLIRDIAPVAGINRVPYVIAVNPSVPAKSVPEFVTYAKANPGKINMASSGNGSVQHVSGKLFKMMTGISMVHVPYRGAAPALTDLLSGQVQVMFDAVSSSIEHIRAGKLRALAMTIATRSDALPDLPTISDFVPGYETSSWSGIGAPKKTPMEIIDKLNEEINVALADPKIKARLDDLGSVPMPMGPANFGGLIAESVEKWSKVISMANIKPE